MVDVFSEGLQGHFVHKSSYAILARLTDKQTRQQVTGKAYSFCEILYHNVFWQDRFIYKITGEEIDLKETMKEYWPSSMNETEQDCNMLVERFMMSQRIPTLKAFMCLAQHNSYYLGQIVMNGKYQDSWLP
ncbi:MAG: hypothetical protein ACXADL_09735 [Candidatus Thorarchaeota archaeon]|jgi:hypothetical protein